ncbi:Lipopolysaccharide kinase (Kdo/WaaP) family protein [Salinimicrobium sediminis]|uniref:Lipopolysaccharide kinase (Kdo/WaaP) family protein n=1 Tax=Salinimicrobium sediminis TaxID=1343891 RepID=A0A285X951_9FLAO|nr:lipopolysaccharide kinase InaA family protein [Salinimicrobium sediminis]SOC81314.1 Lipopolysaccharide kinase (Kdo/WaaP) family protein [Salinimicrobium sediminis]
MKLVISENFRNSKAEILDLIDNFDKKGEQLGNGVRNRIKLFDLQGMRVNVKAFKVPNAVNRVVYRFFRKSKAERSFTYAQRLLEKGIGTPRPIAYLEEKNPVTFVHSYYISEHLSYDLTYRELVQQSDYPDHEKILRAFTRFTWKLHENGVEFLDHSPGNTLIRLNKGDYQFFLVDLNRMNFKNLSLEERMKNFSRLTPQKDMVRVMASEYSKLISQPEEKIFEKMWGYTKEFQKDFQKKKALKKKIKFWKK